MSVDSPDLTGADRDACTALFDDLPASLADEDEREVVPTGAFGAAYGDPAIVVTCGVGVPVGFDETQQCEVADGVGWFVPNDERDNLDSDLTLTAVGWSPQVQVMVPSHYRPDEPAVGDAVTAAVFSQLAAPIKAHLKLVDDCE